MIDQDNQDSSDESVFGAVGTAFADVHLDRDADEVVARGRTLRRRKRAVPALATAGIVAISLSLALAVQPSGGKPLAYKGAVVNVNDAAFSVHTDAKTGIITVTARELFDPKQLQTVLAKAGVRTDIQIKEVTLDGLVVSPCTYTGVTEVVAQGVMTQQSIPGGGVITKINPAAIPAGAVMAFQYFFVSGAPSSQGAKALSYELLSGMPTGGCTPGPVPTATA